MIEKEKIEAWARQQVKYTEEILFLTKALKESEQEIYFWRDEYVKMMDTASVWKHRFFAAKGFKL